ncbi:MAG: M20 family metallopeptidase [Casimicrobiaceae bacterium]|nr:M20 family metallopeptidase [Casimicrobiaceae bacterium]MDW8313302.1 M20 aminoacylase family protein [Burkholderiales bacterium]
MSSLIETLSAKAEPFIAIRRQIHREPELGFEEELTSALVAERLQSFGYTVHRGLAKTGVVGVLKKGTSARSIGLRADMDALPILEANRFAHASRFPGKMHACGHDGHTAMLLAAAEHLAQTPFDGTLHLIFQPAEEGQGGARRMVEEGLFERFPCDAVFAMHNMPGLPQGHFAIRPGPAMASSTTVTVRLAGKGGHGAMPHHANDVVVAGSSIVMALQTIVARNIDPLAMAVVTVGAFHAGEAPNVIPASAEMRLSVRSLDPEVDRLLERRIRAVIEGQAASYGVTAEIDYDRRYPVLVNHLREAELACEVARDLVGPERVRWNAPPVTGSEDFAFMLEKVPGCYLFIGNGDGDSPGACMVHNPNYDFNDANIAVGAAFWVALVKRVLATD